MVAKKTLKDIDRIVQAEDKKERSELNWAKCSVSIIALIIMILLILKTSN